MVEQPFIPPLLPTLVDDPPQGDQWEHEIKYDGYRTMLAIGTDESRAFTRRGHDWAERYAPVMAEAKGLRCTSAYLDGEMIVQDEQGRSDFTAFQSALSRGQSDRFVYCAFDLLALDGTDFRSRPLRDRRAALQELVGSHNPARRIQFSEALPMSGTRMLEAGCELGLEGIVSKRLDSHYRSGRQTSWLKAKCFAEEVFVIVGADRQPGKPAHALLPLETPENGLVYVGSAFVSLAAEDRDRFWRYVDQHRRDQPPIPMPKTRNAAWVEPVLRGQVQFLRGSVPLRHASLRHLRAS
jgi:bifunctional non-homologous end joining protein LigD